MELPQDARYGPAQPGLDEFVLERYIAFTQKNKTGRSFRVWHPPWSQVRVNVQVEDATLLAETAPWFRDARQVAGHYTPGVEDVWIGRPRRLAPEMTDFVEPCFERR